MKHLFPNHDAEDLFWYFIAERQNVWYRRHILQLPQSSWTSDPVIANARFTNVYRELDRGTQYCIAEVIERQLYTNTVPNTVLHMLAYRWFNRIETYEVMRPHLHGMAAAPKASSGLEVALREHSLLRNKLYTGAYIATYCPNMGAEDGIGNAILVLEYIASRVNDICKLIAANDGTLRTLTGYLQEMPGFGNFMAYQAALDFTYQLAGLRGHRLAPHADVNAWTQPGPGAKKGLLLLGVKGSTPTMIRAMRELAQDQDNGFARAGVTFNAPTDKGGKPVPLSVANIEHSLCEYQKYIRMNAGGHTKTVYKQSENMGWRPKYVTTPWWSGATNGELIWQR